MIHFLCRYDLEQNVFNLSCGESKYILTPQEMKNSLDVAEKLWLNVFKDKSSETFKLELNKGGINFIGASAETCRDFLDYLWKVYHGHERISAADGSYRHPS